MRVTKDGIVVHVGRAKVTLLLSILGLILWRHAHAMGVIFVAVIGVVSFLAVALSADVGRYFRRH